MATRFWVGGTGNWDATTTHWSATSGGAGGASVPTAADTVTFDTNSNVGTTAFTVTVTTAALCSDLLVATLDGAMTLAGSVGITVSGQLSLPPTNFTWSSVGLLTFNATTVGRFITTSGNVINSPITFNGVGGVWQLQDALTAPSSTGVTLTAGTLDLNSKTLTCAIFSSNNSNTRTIAFGTGNITVTGAGTSWTTATTTGLTITGTPVVNVSNNSASTTTIAPGALALGSAPTFNFTTGTYSLALSAGSVNDLNFTGFSGSWTPLATTIYGNLTLVSTMTLVASNSLTTFASTTTGKTITTAGKTVDFPITFAGAGGSWILQDTFTMGATRTLTLTSGTLDLNSRTATCGFFTASGTLTRSIAFGTGNITVIGAGGILWATLSTTGLTFTGTPVVNVSYSGALATTINSGILGETTSPSFNFTTGSYALTFLGTASHTAKDINFTGFSGSWGAIAACNVYGSLTLSATMTLTASINTLNFISTSTGKTITSAGKTLDFPIAFNGVGGYWTLQDNFTVGSTRVVTLSNGTLDINAKTTTINTLTILTGTHAIANGTLSCAAVTHTSGDLSIGTGYNIVCSGVYTFTAGTITINNGVTLSIGGFSSSNSNTRSIAFGTGSITTTGTGGVWSSTGVTGFTYTGSGNVIISNNTATAVTISNTGALSAFNFSFINGSYALTLTSGLTCNNLNFTGYTGTAALTTKIINIYGNLNIGLVATITSTVGNSNLTFVNTTGTQTITTNGCTVACGFNIAGVGGTVQFVDNFTQDPTQTLKLTNGTLDLNAKTTSIGILSIATGSTKVTGGTLNCASVTHTSGDITISGTGVVTSTGIYTFTQGNINISNSSTITASSFSSSNSNTRAIAFGTGRITLTGTGTVWDTTIVSGFSYTGTSNVNISNNTATASTLATGYPTPATETQALNFNFTAGTYVLTFINNTYVNSLNFTGFAGTYTAGATPVTIYKDLTLSSSMTTTTNISFGIMFVGVNDSYIKSNGHNIKFVITAQKDTATAAVILSDALFVYTLGHTAGIFDTANYNLTVNRFISSGASILATLNLRSSTVTITGSSGANDVDVGTMTLLTNTATINMTSASAKIFNGGGKTWYKLNQGGVGSLTIAGSNSFSDITNTVQPATVLFQAGTTTTLSNLSLAGTTGNLITIGSDTGAAQHTLSKASGTITLSNCSISYSNATGGASWRAPSNYGNVNGGNNTGWIFTAIAAIAKSIGNFFAFF